jgi:hypothetical protein
MDLQLDEVRCDGGPPTIEATWRGEPLTIGFDTAALFMLAQKMLPDELPAAINAARERIEAAARRLIEQGFLDDAEGARCLLISGLDL